MDKKQNKYPFRMNGYIYSKGTKAGFLRMKRQGIPRPLFRIQDRLARILAARYKRLARVLLRDIKDRIKRSGIVMDSALTQDNEWDDSIEADFKKLREMFEKMRDDAVEAGQKAAARTGMGFIADDLRREWFDEDQEELERLDVQFSGPLDKIFSDEQEDYLGRLFDDADGFTKQILGAFSIDKQKLFNDNMASLRKLYIDNSLQRIKGEEDWMKRRVLERITDWATGKTDELTLDDLQKYAFNAGDHMARLFARDQMQRFNKAVTISTFEAAEVTKVKWVTCGDQRVRKSHKELNGRIFDIDKKPPEKDDYNCRCGLVPVEWAE
jgi:SPP1 gp7 family putative phage head morphogenesis protein